MLEIGKEYQDGKGNRVNIAGLTKDNPQWVWSIQGNWYERTTGRFLWYDPKTGGHNINPSSRDINMEIPPATPE